MRDKYIESITKHCRTKDINYNYKLHVTEVFHLSQR